MTRPTSTPREIAGLLDGRTLYTSDQSEPGRIAFVALPIHAGDLAAAAIRVAEAACEFDDPYLDIQVTIGKLADTVAAYRKARGA